MHLLGPMRSAVSNSSATMAKKSRICSVGAPRPEREAIHASIQSGHLSECPGTSFRAREQSWILMVLHDDQRYGWNITHCNE